MKIGDSGPLLARCFYLTKRKRFIKRGSYEENSRIDLSTPFFDQHLEKRGVISVHNGYSLLFAFNLFLLLSAVIFMEPQKVFREMLTIMFSESHLVTDYVALTSVGGALFNASIMTFCCDRGLLPLPSSGYWRNDISRLHGYGVWFVWQKSVQFLFQSSLGVRLYSYLMNQPLKKYLLIAFVRFLRFTHR